MKIGGYDLKNVRLMTHASTQFPEHAQFGLTTNRDLHDLRYHGRMQPTAWRKVANGIALTSAKDSRDTATSESPKATFQQP
jgi:hypothetical protein